MRVLWTHNFDPCAPNGQLFMDIASSGLRPLGVDLHFEYLGDLRSVGNILKARKRLRGIARGFDLVHAQYGSASALVTSAVDSVPKVVSIRGNDWNVHSASFGFLFLHSRIARAMTRFCLREYDCVLTVSRRMGSEISEYCPGSNVVVMPSPIDLRRFVPRDKQEARAQLGFPDCQEKWILFNALSLDDPVKRFWLANEAFKLAQQRMGNLRLRLATDLPHDVVPLFTAACDLIVCSSETEGWPNCVKEALACNVPFVATDVSDLAEIACQEPSCLVCPDHPAALADGICEALSANADCNLRRHVVPMSLETESSRLLQTYQSLLHGGQRNNPAVRGGGDRISCVE